MRRVQDMRTVHDEKDRILLAVFEFWWKAQQNRVATYEQPPALIRACPSS